MSISAVSIPMSTENLNNVPTDRSSVSEVRSDQPHSAALQHTFTDILGRFVEQDEYEDLPTDNKMIHIIAGAMAGISEHCTLYPVDLIKTRMMAVNAPAEGRYSGIVRSGRSIVATEGLSRLWRGMPVVLAGAGPAHGLYFMSYEWTKQVAGRKVGTTNPLGHMVAGAAASLVHDAVMTPVDAVKQRMQQCNSVYRSNSHCTRCMVRKEGVRSLYRAYGTQICMNIPQQCIHFALYERIKQKLNPNNEYRPSVHIVSGALAGGISAAVTTPLDVCKTLLNTQPTISGVDRPVIRGVYSSMMTIYRVEGPRALWRGWAARVATIAPSTGICWCVYEAFKYGLPWLSTLF